MKTYESLPDKRMSQEQTLIDKFDSHDVVVAVIGGTYFGKHLLSRISKERFVFWFQAVLAVLAVYLIVSTIV
mgnify:CR=1 FL=1